MSIRPKICSLEHTQGFSKIWRSDLVFNCFSEISWRQKIWPSFMIIWLKMWPLERTQGFSNISPVTELDPTRPTFELVRDFIKTNILTKFHDYWPLEHRQGFSQIWPSDLVFDLVFDQIWPILELVRDFIKKNILPRFPDNWTENVASRVYTRFF